VSPTYILAMWQLRKLKKVPEMDDSVQAVPAVAPGLGLKVKLRVRMRKTLTNGLWLRLEARLKVV